MPVSRKLMRDSRVSGVVAGVATKSAFGLLALGCGGQIRSRGGHEDVRARVVERPRQVGRGDVHDDDDEGETRECGERQRLPPRAVALGAGQGVAHGHEPPESEQADQDDDRQRGRWA